MKYIYLDRAGNQAGPVDETEIERRILAGDITGTTAIRSALLHDFRTVDEFICFAKPLKAVRDQKKPVKQEENADGALNLIRRAEEELENKSTAFQHSHTPVDAGVTRRLLSGLFDLAILLLFAAILVFFSSMSLRSEMELVNLEKPKQFEAAPRGPSGAAPKSPSGSAYGAPDTPAGRLARRVAPKLVEVERLNEERNRNLETVANWSEHERGEAAAAPPAAAVPAAPAPAPVPAPAAAEAASDKSPYREITLEDGFLVFPVSETKYLMVGEAAYRQVMSRAVFGVMIATLLYYALSLAIFAQTFGMWFWGIFLARSRLGEVYFLRAYLYALLLPLLGLLMIPTVLVSRRSLADWFCGVRQIRVGSKTS